MPSKSLSFPVVRTVVLLMAVVMIVGASQAQAGSDGQLQYKVTIDQDMAAVRAQPIDSKEGPATLFELSQATGQWQSLKQGDPASSSASATKTLGYAVALDGDYAVVGAEWHDGFTGAAYVYKRNGDGWIEMQKLSPPDLERFDHFGGSVSISGDYAIVSATWQDLFKGAVYVFKRDGSEWILQQKLTSANAMPDERFGNSVRIDDKDITVGIGSADLLDVDMNLAYRFQRSGDTWIEGQKVSNSTFLKSSSQLDDDLVGSVLESDLLVLAENVGRDTDTPPMMAPMGPPPAPNTVVATDGAYEDRTEVFWENLGLDGVYYVISRNGTTVSLSSSDDSVLVDSAGDRGIRYEYCVTATDGISFSSDVCDSGSYAVFAPAELSATDGDFLELVRLGWINPSAVAVGYSVGRDGTEIAVLGDSIVIFDDSTATVDFLHNYSIVAFDSNSVESDTSWVQGRRGLILPPTDYVNSPGTYADSIVLTWTDQSDNEVEFVIVYAESDFAWVDSVSGTGSTVRWVTTDPLFSYGNEYHFSIGAVHSSGSISYTDFKVSGTGILPSPINVSASDSAFDTHTEITWDEPSEYYGTNLQDAFEIKRGGNVLATLDPDVLFYIDTTATPGTIYEYCVTSLSDLGGRSGSICDNGQHAHVVAPSNVQATDGEYEDRVDITWESTATKAVLHLVYRDTVLIKSVNTNILMYSDYGGVAGFDHTYTVRSIDAAGNLSGSTVDLGNRTLDEPGAVTATDDLEDRVELTWSDNSRYEEGYRIIRSGGGFDTTYVSASQTSHNDFIGIPGTTYTYGVVALDSVGGEVGISATVSDDGIRTLLPPTLVVAEDGKYETEVGITWQDNSGAEDGYYIFRDSILIDSVDDNFTSYVDTSPPGGQTSLYGVEAFDAYGTSVAGTDSGSTVLLAPGSVNASDMYSNRVEITWVDLSEIETGYQVYRNGSLIGGTQPANTTLYTDNSPGGSVNEYCVITVSGSETSETVCDDGMSASSASVVTKMTMKLLASDGNADSFFGGDVAISGDYAIVGATGGSGAAYIFERASDGSWSEVLTMQGETTGDRFGHSVAISGDCAIVGAYENESREGAAYIYERATNGSWSLAKKIEASDEATHHVFGVSVGIDYATAIVGATGANGGSGAAYIFVRGATTWPTNETKRIVASDTAADYGFGESVAISGGFAIVGDPVNDNPPSYYQEGAVYFFKRAGNGAWPTTEYNKVVASDAQSQGYFGTRVAISGTRAIVGNRWHTSNQGAAYIIEYDGANWHETEFLTGNPRINSAEFGCSVAIDGDQAIVGAQMENLVTWDEGVAYIFDRNGDGSWTQSNKLIAFDGETSDRLGRGVGIDGGVVIVGAPMDGDQGTRSGAAYIGSSSGSIVVSEAIVASDGTLNSRVRVEWEYSDSASDNNGFDVYRDDELIASVAGDVQSYEDPDAEPGRTYLYSVAISDQSPVDYLFSDLGWRPANGNITGRIATPVGAGVDGISVGLDPNPAKSLLLDGSGGTVRIPHRDGDFAFTKDSSFTVEAWIKYSGNGTKGDSADAIIIAKSGGGAYPFILYNRASIDHPEYLTFEVHDASGNSKYVDAINGDYNDGQWYHVACVVDVAGGALLIYVDGYLQRQKTYPGVLGDITNSADLTFGAGIREGEPYGPFGGQIDEVRIWNVARDSLDIQADMNLPLVGDEDGLVGYWPLDGANTSVATDLTENANYGYLEYGAYKADNAAPVDFTGSTDIEGNYSIDRIRYGQETTFDVTPSFGNRQFSPAHKAITLTVDQPVENQVNFIETSSFTVAGEIPFPGTDCFSPEVEIHVDGILRSLSDKNGKYAIAATYGEHWIKPVLAGRTFTPDSVLVMITRDTAGVDFSDVTMRTLSGAVGGGCSNPIGIVDINIRSENGCYDSTFSYNTKNTVVYTRPLVPQKYIVSASIDPLYYDSIPSEIQIDLLKFLKNLGDRVVDLREADTALNFVYRAPLIVSVSGLDEYRIGCGPLTFNGEDLPDLLPIIPQGTALPLQIFVNEDYGDGNICPLDTGVVVIYDEIFDQQNTPVELVVKDGVANYNSFASTPSLIAGRRDPQGNNRSFQKSFNATAIAEGIAPVSVVEWALVTGHVAPEGADFVTASGTEFLSYILRDPPGDGSYAYIEEGQSIRTRIEYESFDLVSQIGLSVSARFGIKLGTWVGIGGGVWTEIEAKAGFSTETLAGYSRNTESSTDVTITTSSTFATSTNELLTGKVGDVFVGTGYNFVFAEVGVVEVDTENCEVVRSTSVGFEPDSVFTTWAYTHQYINDALIPEYESKVIYYDSLGHLDSARMFTARQQNWERMLAYNDSLKAEATFVNNRSFSAGADFAYEHTTDTTKFATESNGFAGEFSGDFGQFSFNNPASDWGVSVPVRISTEYVDDVTEGDTSLSLTVGYVLEDNDIGDRWTFDIKEDDIFPSPIFDVLAGASSCPYEPWADTSGESRMVPRDNAVLEASSSRDLLGVPQDEAAVFNMTLNNSSGTQETREYVLRELTTSNPGGAILKANGAPLSQGISYFIDGDMMNNSNEVTITVERGPTRYSYDDLALVLYPPCEYALWEDGGALQKSDTILISVSFDAPCSDITLFEPESGWEFNKADEDANAVISLVMTDYELAISPTDTVESIAGEFRRQGTDEEGPSEWVSIPGYPADSLNNSGVMIQWAPQGTLHDGTYELRGFTKCAEGRGFSKVSVGTIDRSNPQVLGSPAPADEELSLGEDISITFNEPIDCETINVDGFLTYLDGPNVGDTIAVEWVCDGTTIVFTPTVAPIDMEGRPLEARLDGVTDLVGNPMDSAEVWTFTVRQSEFTWDTKSIIEEVDYRAPGNITAKLVNGSDSTANFSLVQPMPTWFTSVSPDSGSILPGGTQIVNFTIQDDLAIESYSGGVTAFSDVGSTTLNIFLTVSCQEPEWDFDPSEYQHTMTIVGKVDIGGAISSDANDQVAAFVGSQLRGIANVDPAESMVFLTVGSNRSWGETVRFQVWDSDSCKLYNSTLEYFDFKRDTIFGSPIYPELLTAVEVLPETMQAIPLSQGWNWFSTNVLAVDMSPNGVLSNLTPAEGDVIKTRSAYAIFDPTEGWLGTLQLMDNVSSYMILVSEPGTILQEGPLVDPDSTPVPIDSGWNWIGYLPSEKLPVETALNGLVASLTDGDMIKNQTAFAQYSSSQWHGSLDSMEAGTGYKLYLNGIPTDSTFYFNYPSNSADSPYPPLAGIPSQEANWIVDSEEPEPDWSVDRSAYNNSMSVTATLNIKGTQSRSESDLIGAFVDGECRGLARPIYLSSANQFVVFLMVHSDSASGEKVEFKAFVSEAEAVYNVAEDINYEANANVGTVREPLKLTTSGVASEDSEEILPVIFSLSQNYPNPFNPTTTIEYSLPEQSHATLKVFNVLGQKVRTLVNALQPVGHHSIVWDGKNDNGTTVGSGVYFYKLDAGEFHKSKKMVILK